MPKKWIIILFMLFAALQHSWAVIVETPADSDCTVISANPKANDSDNPILASQQLNAVPAVLTYSYMHFVLPNDFDPTTLSSFNLQLVQTGLSDRSQSLYFFVTDDEIDSESVNHYFWDIAPGAPDDITYREDRYNVNSVEAHWFCTTVVPGGSVGTVVDVAPALSSVNWLGWQTNPYITIFYYPRYHSTQVHTFQSTENSGSPYDGPKLLLDYEPAKVLVSGDPVIVTEGGVSDTYQIVLNAAPQNDVEIRLSNEDQAYKEGEITISPETVTFTPANYAIPQTITITAIDDEYAEQNADFPIIHYVSSDDPAFDGVFARMAKIVLRDNDIRQATVAAVKDCNIKRSAYNTAFPQGDLVPKKIQGGSESQEAIYSYVQFDLPSDYMFAVGSAHLYFTQTSEAQPDGPAEFYIFGIKDGAEPTDPDTFTWITAPGNDPRATITGGLTGFDPETAEYLGILRSVDSGPAGQTVRSLVTAGDEIAYWLCTDTDRKVTFLLIPKGTGESNVSFASVEHAIYEPAKLEISYGDTNYCGRPRFIYDKYDLNKDCIVDLKDYAILAEQWSPSVMN